MQPTALYALILSQITFLLSIFDLTLGGEVVSVLVFHSDDPISNSVEFDSFSV